MDTRFNVSLICDTLLPTWIVYRGKADTLSSEGNRITSLMIHCGWSEIESPKR